MAYKGSLGTPVNIVCKPKNKTTRSCRNCKHYNNKWCKAFNITCSSLGNAKVCKKFQNKHGKVKNTSKKYRCSTCENFIYTNISTNNKAKYGYYCRSRKKSFKYNVTMVCSSYKKKIE